MLRSALVRRQLRAYRAPTSALNHCVELVRQYDPDRFVCNLHAPSDARPGLFALHAFNLETARIRASTSDENIGRMRLLWWRQAVTQAAEGNPPDQPVLQALAHVGVRHRWTWRHIQQVLDAREADLSIIQPESWPLLLVYCEHTAGALCLLARECISQSEEVPEERQAAEQAALQVGAALGIATLLRGSRLHAAQGCTYIPADVAARHELSLKEILRGRPSPALSDAVAEMSNEAISHLLAARSLQRELSAASRAVLLPATAAELILQRLQQCSYSPFAPEMGQPLGVRLQLKVGWNGFRGTF